MYKNIAISGDIGTGKTTLAKKLSEKLGWEYLSGGGLIRKWYEENNLDVSEVNKVPEEVDRKLEEDFEARIKSDKDTIFESRLAGWLARDEEDTLKVLCVTDFGEAMKRVAKREGISLEEAEDKSKIRAEGLIKKFTKLYGVSDFLDEKYFDLVIDTTTNSAEKALGMVLEKLTI